VQVYDDVRSTYRIIASTYCMRPSAARGLQLLVHECICRCGRRNYTVFIAADAVKIQVVVRVDLDYCDLLGGAAEKSYVSSIYTYTVYTNIYVDICMCVCVCVCVCVLGASGGAESAYAD
jgi:hypothetical protein